MEKLPLSFYQRENVLGIARDLLGKLLVTKWNGIITSGRIVECEAYAGLKDRASHAFGGRRTARNEMMYSEGGVAYIYLCYGIHHLFNVVTNMEEVPHAVLVRALQPVLGIVKMMQRTKKESTDNTKTSGPGNLTKALGIYTQHNGISLQGNEIFIADDGFEIKKKDIAASPRIGVAYAGNDAGQLYRFFIKRNSFVSGKRKSH